MDDEWPPLTLHLLTQVYRLGKENSYEKADRFSREKDIRYRHAFLAAMGSDSSSLIQELDETLRAQVLEIMSRKELSSMLQGAVCEHEEIPTIVKTFGKRKRLILALLYADAWRDLFLNRLTSQSRSYVVDEILKVQEEEIQNGELAGKIFDGSECT
jgi:hypothetical protein